MKAAIKILHTQLSGRDIDEFQQEARVIADLKHPHIVRVLDFDVQDGKPFLVLDYAANGTLRQKHPRGARLPLDLVVHYAEQVASALQYAHDRRLIHRDIKPENMLIGDQGEVLLSDFGIATIAHSTFSMNTQASMGTLAYMAPEQIQGKPRPASDQYALAVTAYQWLCGEMPFQGSSTEILAQHLAVLAPPLRSKASDIPAEVEQVVLKALSKDPKQRFKTVQAFAQALEYAAYGKRDEAMFKASPDAEPLPSVAKEPTTLPAQKKVLPSLDGGEVQRRVSRGDIPSPWRVFHSMPKLRLSLLVTGFFLTFTAVSILMGLFFLDRLQQMAIDEATSWAAPVIAWGTPVLAGICGAYLTRRYAWMKNKGLFLVLMPEGLVYGKRNRQETPLAIEYQHVQGIHVFGSNLIAKSRMRSAVELNLAWFESPEEIVRSSRDAYAHFRDIHGRE